MPPHVESREGVTRELDRTGRSWPLDGKLTVPAAALRSCPGERPQVRQERSASGVLDGQRLPDPHSAAAVSRTGR